MKTKISIAFILFYNLTFGQNQIILNEPWYLDKFIINGSDVTYTTQTNHIHYIVFQGNGMNTNLIAGYCETLFGLIGTIENNTFSYENTFSYGPVCNITADDILLRNTIMSFYFFPHNNFNYTIIDVGNYKKLTITNSSNNTVIYNSVNLNSKNFNAGNDLNVYPNPVDNILNFKSDWEVNTVKIHSAEGRLINIDLNNQNNQIDVSHLQSGIYFVEFEINNKSIRKKIIKK
jgi:hypothetical protein